MNAEHSHATSAPASVELAALAGGLAHEIRNPLSTMGLNLELVIEELAEAQPKPGSPAPANNGHRADAAPRETPPRDTTGRDQRLLRKLKVVQNECQRLETILDAFLQFVRVEGIHLQRADFNAVVREFIDFFRLEATSAQVELSPHLESDLPAVPLDTPLFRQVLHNLSRNAVQAMPKGGLIEFQTYLRDGLVHLDLIDNGQGMTPETQARIFDYFYSTKPDGTGLGLPTCKKIVEAHGGHISVASAPGQGTRFTITLPPA